MFPRISKCLFGVIIAAGVLRAAVAQAQEFAAPLQLTSLEWLVADSGVVAVGVVLDSEDSRLYKS